ncbi:hypothetical protein [Paludisphaera sp.]|uniref:hypothetical protein n=1 Tax=Paludisphaera sp. TaxID=2017432 RepID=UPI00301DF3EF
MARSCSTICLPVDQSVYRDLVDDPGRFRGWLDEVYPDSPELFPRAFAEGYRLKDDHTSVKLGVRLRRVRCKSGGSFSVRPCFVLPYMVGYADEACGPLFQLDFGVPSWASARVFGRGVKFWYRLEVAPERNSVVGTTARRAELPEHLLADEHHQPRDGSKNYVATTVAEGCCLGAALARTAGAEDLRAACGVFASGARDVRPDYRPRTASVDGWALTHKAWLALFPLIGPLSCFLHGWLNIRSRGKLKQSLHEMSRRAWESYHALSRGAFSQRLRRLRGWARRQGMSTWLLEQVEELRGRSREYAAAYSHPGGHRASNMLDRVMRSMNRYFDDGRHLQGGAEARDLHCRAWALLYNFRPYHPAVTRKNDGRRCPAERLNEHRYRDEWLQNLLISASLGGFRR